jgi:AcrR family transcriptional regulator
MPKVSEEHKSRRREQILEGARRVFARDGYEGATVARLEEEIGLSRGAIFNYFPNKQAIFIELAAETSERLTGIWLERGFRTLLDELVKEDPDWLAVQLEAVRRLRTDEDFRNHVLEREQARLPELPERLERLRAQGVRDDVPIDTVAIFLSVVANGLALRMTMGDRMPDLDAFAELVEHGVGAKPGKRPTSRRSVRATPRRS